MSHLGTRLIADRLASPTDGIAAFVALLTPVLDVGDVLPTQTVTVVDDTRHDVFAGLPDDSTAYPLVRVLTTSVDYQPIRPSAADQWVLEGTLSVAVQLLLREGDEAQSAADGMYLLQAMRGALIALSQADATPDRTRPGVQLQPHATLRQGQVDAPVGDLLVSPGSYLLTYPFVESIPLMGIV